MDCILGSNTISSNCLIFIKHFIIFILATLCSCPILAQQLLHTVCINIPIYILYTFTFYYFDKMDVTSYILINYDPCPMLYHRSKMAHFRYNMNNLMYNLMLRIRWLLSLLSLSPPNKWRMIYVCIWILLKMIVRVILLGCLADIQELSLEIVIF